MSAFAVAAFHDATLPVGAAGVEAVIWIRAAGLDPSAAEVALRVWTPAGAQLTAWQQIAPDRDDLLARAVHLDERTLECACEGWSDGVYESELAIALPARAAGDRLLAARVGVVAGEEVMGSALVAVTWIGALANDDRAEPGGELATGASPRPGADPADELATGASPRPGADPADELPTGASPHSGDDRGGHPAAAAAGLCPACGARPEDGDRYCEACGRELTRG